MTYNGDIFLNLHIRGCNSKKRIGQIRIGIEILSSWVILPDLPKVIWPGIGL